MQLGINTTCTLQSDHYHLFANVFLDFFGDYIYFQTDLQKVLSRMLTNDKEEWENRYKNAKAIIQTNNRHFEYIHTKYIWLLRNILCGSYKIIEGILVAKD